MPSINAVKWPDQMKRLILSIHKALASANNGKDVPGEQIVVEGICREFGGERIYFPAGLGFDALSARKKHVSRDAEKTTKRAKDRIAKLDDVIESARTSCEGSR